MLLFCAFLCRVFFLFLFCFVLFCFVRVLCVTRFTGMAAHHKGRACPAPLVLFDLVDLYTISYASFDWSKGSQKVRFCKLGLGEVGVF